MALLESAWNIKGRWKPIGVFEYKPRLTMIDEFNNTGLWELSLYIYCGGLRARDIYYIYVCCMTSIAISVTVMNAIHMDDVVNSLTWGPLNL